jgi:molybdopterin-dependent oxidoreductase alpha subunit
VDRTFIADHTTGYAEAEASARALSFEELQAASGASRAEMLRFAELLRDSKRTILVWSMGLTQHAHGVETIQALVNVGLAQGSVGREGAGLMPIRGHSGVQGGAEVGCTPALDEAQRRRFEEAWGFALPEFPGLTASEMVDVAYHEGLDAFWIVGGNFLETLPDPAAAARAVGNVATRIHQDIVLTTMMLVPPKDTVLLFPATTRYESPGGGTETSTERRIIFSPEIPGRRIGSARAEWDVFGEVAARVRPERAAAVRFGSSQAIRDEIARTIPLYAGIEGLRVQGDQVQWGGRHLFADGAFATPDGKARFSALKPRVRTLLKGEFFVSTRRGKQFNSMVQRETDPLTGAVREDVFVSREDAERLGLKQGDRLRLTSVAGSYTGRAFIAEMKPGNLAVHWPEGNVLLTREEADALSHEPDYNARVRLERLG